MKIGVLQQVGSNLYIWVEKFLEVKRNTLRDLVKWKKLPVLQVGRKVLIKTDILEQFMEANEGRDLKDKNTVRAVSRKTAVT